MSRFKDFVKYETKKYEDVSNILSDFGVTADIYRYNYTKNGITGEVGSKSLVKRILVFFADDDLSPVTFGDVTSSKVNYLLITDYQGVRMSDEIVIDQNSYKVLQLGTAYKSQVQIKVQRNA